jgi:cytochrome c553
MIRVAGRQKLIYSLSAMSCLLFFLYGSWVSASHDVRMSEDVSRTKHNLSSNPDINATGTTEICVFCHTPHGGNSVAAGHAPLWNRLLPDDSSYEIYGSPHFDDQDVAGTHRPKGVSLACLSCHDGSIAFDSLINGPGSGGFISANLDTGRGPGVSNPTINFVGGGIVDSASSFAEGLRDSNEVETTEESPFSGGLHDLVHGAGSGGEGAQPIPNLGQDLRDDHPIGMEIPCSIDTQFDEICENLSGSKLDGGTDGANVAFISRTSSEQALVWPLEKRDRLRAYPSTEQPGRYFIECASCHNPHTPRVSFLRLPSGVPGLVRTNLLPTDASGHPRGKSWGQRPNFGSAICLSCHEK